MKLAIMQPYFIPYLGYFQMMNAVDEFIVYDDVNYKRGWIHRNKTTFNGQEIYLGLSLSKASQNKKINEIELNPAHEWRQDLLKTIEHRYGKCPQFEQVEPMVFHWIHNSLINNNLAKFLHGTLSDIAEYLEMDTKLTLSSQTTDNQHLRKGDRLIDICKQRGAEVYVNAIGGQELYTKESFAEHGIQLKFIQMNNPSYQSILDVLMENSKEDIQKALNDYSLL